MTDTDTTTDEVVIDEDQKVRILARIEMLQWLLENPELANSVWISKTFDIYAYDGKEDFDHKRRLLGPHTKEVNEYEAIAKRDFGPELPFSWNEGERCALRIVTRRDNVCQKVQVGTKVVEKQVVPEGVEMLTVVEEEPVYEWECPDSWGE